MVWERLVLGKPIRVEAKRLDAGWDVSVMGGDMTHVGAVTLAEPDDMEQTLERPGHKDSFISRLWAVRLAKVWHAPVCVRCGIHYDNATTEQIQAIVAACNALLEEIAA